MVVLKTAQSNEGGENTITMSRPPKNHRNQPQVKNAAPPEETDGEVVKKPELKTINDPSEETHQPTTQHPFQHQRLPSLSGLPTSMTQQLLAAGQQWIGSAQKQWSSPKTEEAGPTAFNRKRVSVFDFGNLNLFNNNPPSPKRSPRPGCKVDAGLAHQRPTADQLLEDIALIKESRKNLPANTDLGELKNDLLRKLEKKLEQLLFIVMEDMPMHEDINANIRTVVQNVDQLKGKMVDGHLKTRLLYEFLKEYKKIASEQLESEEVDQPNIQEVIR